MDEGYCKICPDNFYSYSGDTNCTACPNNSTSSPYQAFCTCPVGNYWNFNKSNCDECSYDHFMNVTNSTGCTECPENSRSWRGSSKCFCNSGYKMDIGNTTECEICPANHFSQFGSTYCRKCPIFKTSRQGSDSCYRCVFGQYWEDHTCLQCPEHMFGDGVHCNRCPRGFQVEKGFCYKVSDQSQDIKKLQVKDEEYEKTVKVLRNGLIGIAAFLAVVFLIWSYVKFCHHSSVLDDPIVEKEISVGSFTTNTPHNKTNSVTMIEDGESGQKVNF